MKEKNEISGNRVAWIDALKGIALLGVIMIHAGGQNYHRCWERLGK